MLVTTVITRLPPAVDGVGDYALNLAVRSRQDFDIETHFVVGDPNWSGAKEIEGFPVTQVSAYSAKALLSLLPKNCSSPTTVLVHYVNYGYAKRGCPVWLVDGLHRWQAANVNRSIVTMFHEVYAFGRPPWTSSFWLSPLQKHLAARLAKLSDRCLTSRQDYAKILSDLSLGKHTQIPALPVFSGIGEPEQVLPLTERDRRLVVFGSPSNRLRVYQASFRELALTCQRLGISEIWDIGPSTKLPFSVVGNVPIVEIGQQSATQISHILSTSLVGFFNYNPEYLAKSTIFAAYCAHGVLPVSSHAFALPVDGIIAGKHYWTPDEQTENLNLPEPLQAIADTAHAWYQSHNLSVQAKIFATLLALKR